MKQYIERHAAIAAIGVDADMLHHGETESIRDKINAIPAADVAPVVRCGECIHRVNMEHSMDNKEICCGRRAMRVMALDDYCSHGVRIDGGERHAD